jgi:hypothetical protein
MYYKLPSTCGRYSVQALIATVTSLAPWCVYGNKGSNLNFTHVRSAHLYSVFCVTSGRRICRSFQLFFTYIPDPWKLFLNLSVRLSSPRNSPYLFSTLNNWSSLVWRIFIRHVDLSERQMNRNCHVTDDVFCYSNEKESSASSKDDFCVNIFTVHFVITLEISVVCYALPREIINSPFFFASFCVLQNRLHGFPCSCRRYLC